MRSALPRATTFLTSDPTTGGSRKILAPPKLHSVLRVLQYFQIFKLFWQTYTLLVHLPVLYRFPGACTVALMKPKAFRSLWSVGTLHVDIYSEYKVRRSISIYNLNRDESRLRWHQLAGPGTGSATTLWPMAMGYGLWAMGHGVKMAARVCPLNQAGHYRKYAYRTGELSSTHYWYGVRYSYQRSIERLAGQEDVYYNLYFTESFSSFWGMHDIMPPTTQYWQKPRFNAKLNSFQDTAKMVLKQKTTIA